jgi:hypothetical protein
MCIICQGKKCGYANLVGKTEIDCGCCQRIKEVPNVQGLLLLNCSECINLVKIAEIEGLKEIWCQCCPKLTTIPKIKGLTDLTCHDCDSLIGIPDIDTLEILDCCRCPLISWLPHFPNLEELWCNECPLIKEIPVMNKLERIFTSCKKVPVMKNLEILSYNFSQIYSSDVPNIENLNCLEFRNCPNLKEIRFCSLENSDHTSKKFQGLKTLLIYDCENLTEIGNIEGLERLDCDYCPNLTVFDFEFYSKESAEFVDDEITEIVFRNRFILEQKFQEKREMTLKLESDLGRATWEPTRAMRWCWDEEQKREFLDDIRDPTEKEEIRKLMF